MMRVASARPIGPESGNIIWGSSTQVLTNSQSGIHPAKAANIQFTVVQEALKSIEFKVPERDINEQNKVVKFMGAHDSLEHFMTRPLLSQGSLLGLTIPRPLDHLKMSPLDMRLYEVLAVRYLYPEVRFIHAISQKMASKMASDGFLISRNERLLSQEECFADKNFTESCLYEKALKPVVSQIIEEVNTEHESDLVADVIYEQTLALIEKGGSNSVVYWEAYAIEAAESYEKTKTLGEMLLTCVNYPRRFFSWQLIGIGRCDRALKDELAQKGIRSEKIVSAVINNVVMNRFSPLQKALVSLSEDVLDRGIFCFSEECVEKKIRKRLDEWSMAGELTSEEKLKLTKALSIWWVD